MSIKIKLKKGVVTVNPMSHGKDHGKHKVHWEMANGSDTFTFDVPPIKFRELDAPFSDMGVDDDVVCATDNNVNMSGKDIEYPYQVNLIDKDGNKITWPATSSEQQDGTSGHNSLVAGDPVIKNRPGGGV